MLSGSSCAFPTIAFLLVNFLVVGITIAIMKRNPAARSSREGQSLGSIQSNGAGADLYTPLGSGNDLNGQPSHHFAMEMGRRSPEVTDHEAADRDAPADSEYVPPSLGNDDSQVDSSAELL